MFKVLPFWAREDDLATAMNVLAIKLELMLREAEKEWDVVSMTQSQHYAGGHCVTVLVCLRKKTLPNDAIRPAV